MATGYDLLLQNLKDTKSAADSYSQDRAAGEAKIKEEQGYDQRLKTLEGLRKSVYDSERLLSNLPKDVQNRTRGRLITAGQQNRLLAKEQQPLAETLAGLSRSADVEQQGVEQVRSLLADFLQGQSLDFDTKMKSLGLANDYAKQIISKENAAEQRAWEEKMREADRNLQRGLAAMNRPSLPSLQPILDMLVNKQTTTQPTSSSVSWGPVVPTGGTAGPSAQAIALAQSLYNSGKAGSRTLEILRQAGRI